VLCQSERKKEKNLPSSGISGGKAGGQRRGGRQAKEEKINGPRFTKSDYLGGGVGHSGGGAGVPNYMTPERDFDKTACWAAPRGRSRIDTKLVRAVLLFARENRSQKAVRDLTETKLF